MGLLGTIGGIAGNVFGGPIGGIVGAGLGNALEGGNSQQQGAGISSALQTAGGLMSAEQARQANQKYADQFGAAQNLVGGAASFRPVGITTRFGSSNFTYNPQTGQMESAGYNLSPAASYAQDQLQQFTGQGLDLAKSSQGLFAPLTTGATNLMNLGNQYIGQNPNDVAAQYIKNQQNLLQPSRDVANANLATQLQNTGRTGLAVAQGGNLGQANPEAQALANAQALQDLTLASQGQQMGQQNTLFGANLLGQGAGTLNNYYGGISGSLNPYTTGVNSMYSLENMGQQPLSLSSSLGQQSATAGANAGRNYLTAMGLGAGYGTSNAATVSPGGTFLSGIAPSLGQGIGNWLGSSINTGVQGLGQTNPISGEYMGSLEF
jgi:hypothetical protein